MSIGQSASTDQDLVPFEYGLLDAETRIVVQQKTGEIRDRINRSRQDMIEIGERLIEIKARLGHGRFLTWLAAEFDWSVRTADNLMSVAEAFKFATVANLPIGQKALYALASPSVPEAARVEAVALAESGEDVTHADARRIIADHKAKPIPQPESDCDEEATDDGGESEPPRFVPAREQPGPLVNYGAGPMFPPKGVPKSTEGWLAETSRLNRVYLFVREQGGIEGSIYGWTPIQVNQLTAQLILFRKHLDGWIDHLRSER